MSQGWREFQGVNAAYVLELYERFRRDPKSVDPAARALFEASGPPDEAQATPASDLQHPAEAPETIVGAVNLAQSIRLYGHLAAQIDPLGSRPLGDPALLAETHGVTEADLRALPASLTGEIGRAHV